MDIVFLEEGIPGKVKMKENGIVTSTKIQYPKIRKENKTHVLKIQERGLKHTNMDLAVLAERQQG